MSLTAILALQKYMKQDVSLFQPSFLNYYHSFHPAKITCPPLTVITCFCKQGVTRLDGARCKKQVWRPPWPSPAGGPVVPSPPIWTLCPPISC